MHALAYQVWTELLGEAPVLLSENDARRTFALANPQLGRRERSDCWEEVNLARERRQEAENADEAAAYAQRKAVLNLVDYTDLLEFWIQQVDCGNYTRRFTHVLVDEVQDMSRLQLDVLQRLLPASGQGLFAIGDPRQSIYAFRGADPHVKDTLQSFWSELKTITLSDSHRSGRRILDLASSLFPDMPALRAAGKDDDPGRITMFTAGGARQEAAWIGEKILSLLGGTAHWQADRGQGGSLGPGDICILVRLRQLIPVLHAVLEKMGVPCRVPEKELFFHDPLVASLVDEGRRVTGITLDNGQGEDEPLCPDHVVAAGPEAMAEFLSARPEFREALARSKAFAELKVLYADHQGWAGVFREIALLGELEAVRSKSQKVQIMTLHAAKGLEFDTVFLPALEDGILPLADLGVLVAQEKGARRVISDEQEERRLFFVGLTRASKRVYLSRSQERTLFGRSVRLPMSRFLKELPSDLMHMRRARAHVRVQHKPLKMDL
jgi:superfamily I DNA/RNA helicase